MKTVRLLELVRRKQASEVSDKWAAYVELLGRADNPRDGDADKLAALMKSADLSPEQVEMHARWYGDILADVQTFAAGRELEPKRDALEAHVLEARKTAAAANEAASKLAVKYEELVQRCGEASDRRYVIVGLCNQARPTFDRLYAELCKKHEGLAVE